MTARNESEERGMEMIRKAAEIRETSTWKELTPGAEIYEPMTSWLVWTGEWRTSTPVLDREKCTNCLLCVPFCPDVSIPVRDGKRLETDLEHCKGCGICAEVCGFGALTMKGRDEE
jgi:pyruvate ferredoxin oxidoreductase delta subunit